MILHAWTGSSSRRPSTIGHKHFCLSCRVVARTRVVSCTCGAGSHRGGGGTQNHAKIGCESCICHLSLLSPECCSKCSKFQLNDGDSIFPWMIPLPQLGYAAAEGASLRCGNVAAALNWIIKNSPLPHSNLSALVFFIFLQHHTTCGMSCLLLACRMYFLSPIFTAN